MYRISSEKLDHSWERDMLGKKPDTVIGILTKNYFWEFFPNVYFNIILFCTAGKLFTYRQNFHFQRVQLRIQKQ